jgi:hypothetical protein
MSDMSDLLADDEMPRSRLAVLLTTFPALTMIERHGGSCIHFRKCAPVNLCHDP